MTGEADKILVLTFKKKCPAARKCFLLLVRLLLFLKVADVSRMIFEGGNFGSGYCFDGIPA